MDRHFSPAEEVQSLFLDDDLEDLLSLISLQLILREEEHADAIVPLSFDRDAERLTDFLKKLVRDLKQDPHAVSRLPLCVFSRPVLQMLYDLERAGYGTVAFPALDVYDRADTAVVVFKAFPV